MTTPTRVTLEKALKSDQKLVNSATQIAKGRFTPASVSNVPFSQRFFVSSRSDRQGI